MLRSCAFVLSALLIGAPAVAQDVAVPAAAPPAKMAAAPAPAATATAAVATSDADPALWVVKDADTTIYLFGTIHVLKPGLSWFDEAVKSAFDRSDTLMLEMVMPDPVTAQKAVLARAIDPSGTPLTQKIPAADRPAYAKAVEDMGLPPAAFDRMEPWFVATNLSLLPVLKAGYDPANGPEQVLTKAAAAEHKPVEGLETFDQQLGYLDGLSAPAQMDFLTSTVRDMPKAVGDINAMVTDWAKGDPDALGRLMNGDMRENPEVARVLLTERNARWANWIKARMAKPGTLFIAVGAGHLAGPDSVIADLERLHVKVTRVRY